MNLIELDAVLGGFFEAVLGVPSHDQMDGPTRRTVTLAADPAPEQVGRRVGTPLGRTKRVRQILTYATDHDPGRWLVIVRRASGRPAPVLRLVRARP